MRPEYISSGPRAGLVDAERHASQVGTLLYKDIQDTLAIARLACQIDHETGISRQGRQAIKEKVKLLRQFMRRQLIVSLHRLGERELRSASFCRSREAPFPANSAYLGVNTIKFGYNAQK